MIVDTNVNGPFLMAREVAPHMLKQGWGRIINISMNHETMRRAGFSPYGPSKAALESETIIWAQDLAGTGVTVNSLLPGGAADTGMVPNEISRARLLDPNVIVATVAGFGIRRESNGRPLCGELVGFVATAGEGCRKSAQRRGLEGSSTLGCGKSLFAVIPNEVRNLS
jgi:NAD(P)-dependent dehydrogenase (short-subunit alcohol dehydrogenase family)